MGRNKAHLLPILLLALPLAAQTDSVKPATVEGAVTDAVTGAAIPRVHVTLQGSIDGQPGQYGTTTTADGKFSITGIAPGSYSVQGERVGYVMPSGPRGRVQLTLKADDNKSGIEIKLTPTGAITGRVTGADGEPAEGVNVTAQGPRSDEFTNTDEKGQFRIGGLAPGKYRVKASVTGDMWGGRPEIRTDGTVEVHNAATYYPGTLAEKEAGRVQVRPGGETNGVDIQLASVPFVRVSGKVIGMPRGVVGNIIVWQGQGGNGIGLKPDGSFAIWRLDPGKYALTAEWEGPDGREVRTTPAEIEVAGSNIDNLELRAVPDSTITGRLESEIPEEAQPTSERVVTLMEVRTGRAGDTSAPVAADGTFRLEKVPAGKYRVALSGTNAYVKSMRLGSTVIDGAVLDLSNGSGGADLSLLVTAATGSISGTVQDDSGNAASAIVALTSGEDEFDFVPDRQVTAKADGAYTFTNLPPGTYRIVAMQDAGQGNSVFGYEDLMEAIEVRDGEKVTKDLKRQTGEAQ